MTRLPVVVHRWFAQGEAWAWAASHPAIRDREGLDQTFDALLKSARPGRFQVPARDGKGLWVGSVEPDSTPLDPRVRPGDSPLLRAALVPGEPDEQQRQQILHRLASLDPRKPGPAAELWIEADVKPAWSLGLWFLWLLVLLLTLAVIGGGYLLLGGMIGN